MHSFPANSSTDIRALNTPGVPSTSHRCLAHCPSVLSGRKRSVQIRTGQYSFSRPVFPNVNLKTHRVRAEPDRRSRQDNPLQYERDVWRDASKNASNYPPARGNSSKGGPQPSVEYGNGGNGRNGGNSNRNGNDELSGFTKSLIAGAFVLGIGAGVYFSSEVTTEPNNVASTEIVDRRTPNSEVCMANGYSSMVFDQRIFVSFNPFNVYVAQPEVKPGCILRRSNFQVLEKRKLVNQKEVESCKKNMNTFAFVGNLNDQPEISCVYHSEDAENQFIVDPKKAVMGDGYQPRIPKDAPQPKN